MGILKRLQSWFANWRELRRNWKDFPDVAESFKGRRVSWESGGVLQFASRRVRGLSFDGQYLFVKGSKSGIPLNEVEVVEEEDDSFPAFLVIVLMLGIGLGLNFFLRSDMPPTLKWPLFGGAALALAVIYALRANAPGKWSTWRSERQERKPTSTTSTTTEEKSGWKWSWGWTKWLWRIPVSLLLIGLLILILYGGFKFSKEWLYTHTAQEVTATRQGSRTIRVPLHRSFLVTPVREETYGFVYKSPSGRDILLVRHKDDTHLQIPSNVEKFRLVAMESDRLDFEIRFK